MEAETDEIFMRWLYILCTKQSTCVPRSGVDAGCNETLAFGVNHFN